MIHHIYSDMGRSNGVTTYGRLVDALIDKSSHPNLTIYHYELGYNDSALFWEVRKELSDKEASKRVVLTVHDAPIVIGKPFDSLIPFKGFFGKAVRKALDITLGRRMVARLLKHVDAIIVLNTRSKQELVRFLKLDADRIYVLGLFDMLPPSKSGMAPMAPSRGGAVRLLFFGNRSPRKGVNVLLSALQEISYKEDLILDIVGSDAGNNTRYMDQTNRLIAGLPESIKVMEHGFVEDTLLRQFIEKCDIVLLPYLDEGIVHASGPLASAMAAGKPVVATDIPTFSAVVRSAETGLLVPPGDISKLAAAISNLLREGTLRAKLGKKAAELMKSTYNKTQTEKALNRIYGEL